MALDSMRFKETKEKNQNLENPTEKMDINELKSLLGMDEIWTREHEQSEKGSYPFASTPSSSKSSEDDDFDLEEADRLFKEKLRKEGLIDPDYIEPLPRFKEQAPTSSTPEDVEKAQEDFNALLESMLGYGENHDENEMGGKTR